LPHNAQKVAIRQLRFAESVEILGFFLARARAYHAKCTGLEERAENSRRRLEAARTELAQAGVVPSDPQARRLTAILPVSEEAIQLYQPLILPISISVLGLLLIAVGAHTPKRRKAKRRRGRRKRQALGRVGRPSAKVIPFKKAN
jgi:hypothetical protein